MRLVRRQVPAHRLRRAADAAAAAKVEEKTQKQELHQQRQRADQAEKAMTVMADAQKKGLCFDFLNGACNKENCTYKHELIKGWKPMPAKAKAKSKAKAKTGTAIPASQLTPEQKAKTGCSFHRRGHCKFGDECPWSHDPAIVAALPCIEVGSEEEE